MSDRKQSGKPPNRPALTRDQTALVRSRMILKSYWRLEKTCRLPRELRLRPDEPFNLRRIRCALHWARVRDARTGVICSPPRIVARSARPREARYRRRSHRARGPDDPDSDSDPDAHLDRRSDRGRS
jgi:hypothetical protein